MRSGWLQGWPLCHVQGWDSPHTLARPGMLELGNRTNARWGVWIIRRVVRDLRLGAVAGCPVACTGQKGGKTDRNTSRFVSSRPGGIQALIFTVDMKTARSTVPLAYRTDSPVPQLLVYSLSRSCLDIPHYCGILQTAV
jgi:hypothetical protein